jgi:preprotein translocase subunit SecF
MLDLTTVIPFMRYRMHCVVLSAVLVVASIIAIAVNGFNFALDFTGGTQVQMEYATPPDLEQIRQTLDAAGFSDHEVVALGTDTNIQIRIQNTGGGEETEQLSGETATSVVEVLTEVANGQVTFGGSAFIGAQVGDELREQGILGMLVAAALLMLFIAARFQFKFSVGSVLSLVHNGVITLGFIAVARIDFDQNVLASILAVIGYSLNDTVVVSDRVRENFRSLRGVEPERIIDIALSQTLVRTMITVITTLLVLFALLIFGGQVLYGFSIVLIVGVIVGTYASIYIATSTLMFLNLSKEDMMPPVKAKEELDALP